MTPAFATAPVSGSATAAHASSATWSSRKCSTCPMLRDGERVERAAQRADEAGELGGTCFGSLDGTGAYGDPVDELRGCARVLRCRDAEPCIERSVGDVACALRERCE